jgi:hypothetical protein
MLILMLIINDESEEGDDNHSYDDDINARGMSIYLYLIWSWIEQFEMKKLLSRYLEYKCTKVCIIIYIYEYRYAFMIIWK